ARFIALNESVAGERIETGKRALAATLGRGSKRPPQQASFYRAARSASDFDGRSIPAKPRSNKAAAMIVRLRRLGAPKITAMSLRPSRLATRFHPAAQVNPVFMPSAPG